LQSTCQKAIYGSRFPSAKHRIRHLPVADYRYDFGGVDPQSNAGEDDCLAHGPDFFADGGTDLLLFFRTGPAKTACGCQTVLRQDQRCEF